MLEIDTGVRCADYSAERLARIKYLLDLGGVPKTGYQLALAD